MMIKRPQLPATFAVLCLALWAGLASAQDSLAALLQSDPELSTLLDYVGLVPGLADSLGAASNVTILAPTNAAFQALLDGPEVPERTAAETRNVTSVAALLANHVVQGAYFAENITESPAFVQTLLNSSFTNDIQPFTNTTGGQYIGLIRNGQDVDVLSGEFAVSRVTQANIRFGETVIIHKIDRTLAFGPPLQTFASRANLTAALSAIATAGLAGDNITGTGEAGTSPLNYADNTIFIPNNEAFENIGSILGATNQSSLAQVLSYHVVPGRILFSTALGNASAPTLLGGSDLQTTVFPDGSAFVNEAKVVLPNIILYNGVAHIIDSVLNPAEAASFDRASVNPTSPASERVAFSNATRETDIPLATLSASATPYTSTPAIFTTASAVSRPAAEGGSTDSAPVGRITAKFMYASLLLAGVIAFATSVL